MYRPAIPPQNLPVSAVHPNLTMIVLVATYASNVFTGKLTGEKNQHTITQSSKAAPPREANTPALPPHSFLPVG